MPTTKIEAARTAADVAPRGLCVLIVEDDEADAYLIKRGLAAQAEVETVVVAPDGVEAFRMVEAREVEPDLAFIDLQMPRKNGFNLLAALASCDVPRFPMVVLTSSTAPTDAMRSRLRGAIRVVTKPDTEEGMAAELARAIAAVRPYTPDRTPQQEPPLFAPPFPGASAIHRARSSAF